MSINYIVFKFNYKYYFYIFYKKNLNFYSKLRIIKFFFQAPKVDNFLLTNFLLYPKT